jgi:hypothetical protein
MVAGKGTSRDGAIEWLTVGGIALLIVLGCVAGPALIIGGVSAQSPTPIPAAYYGNITVNGEPAPDGLLIEAEINGDVRGSIQTENGGFGGPAADDEKLIVDGEVDEDGTATVSFYVSGNGIDRTQAEQTVTWESAGVERIDLSVPSASLDPEPDDSETSDGSDSGGSGGGGGGGGGGIVSNDETTEGPSPVSSTSAEITDSDPTEEGTTVAVGETSVSSITFSEGTTGTVEINDYGTQPPPDSPDPGDRPIISGVTITVPDTAANSPATIELSLDSDVVASSGTDPSELVVLRGVDDEYQVLPTTVAERGDTITVTAETPGFSTFLVSTEEQSSGADQPGSETDSTDSGETQAETDDDDEPTTDTSEVDTSDDNESLTGIVVVLGLLLLVVVFAWFRPDRQFIGTDTDSE